MSTSHLSTVLCSGVGGGEEKCLIWEGRVTSVTWRQIKCQACCPDNKLESRTGSHLHVKTALKSLLVWANEQMSFYNLLYKPLSVSCAGKTCNLQWQHWLHFLVSAMNHKSIKSNRVHVIPGSLYPVLNSFLGGRSVPSFIYVHTGMGTALLTPLCCSLESRWPLPMQRTEMSNTFPPFSMLLENTGKSSFWLWKEVCRVRTEPLWICLFGDWGNTYDLAAKR